ncbi:MAG TPA: DMT family transporter [Baekduia sp.]|nr:DMT family transporter [Baekduia sp.]
MAIVLALTTSVLYGVSNYLGPTLSRTAPLFVVLIAGQAVAFAVSGALALAGGEELLDGGQAAAAIAAGLGNAAGLLCLYRAAALGPLSLVIPIGAVGAAVPVAVGIAGGESASVLKLTGIALALAGVALAARRPSGAPAHASDADRGRAIFWALASALAFGVFLAGMAPAAEGGVLWAVCLSRAALLVILFGAAFTMRRELRVPLAELPRLAVPGVLLFGGTLSYSAATREGDLSVVSVLGSLFPVVTVALAFVFLHERVSRVQGAGIVATLVGIVLLSAR